MAGSVFIKFHMKSFINFRQLIAWRQTRKVALKVRIDQVSVIPSRVQRFKNIFFELGIIK